MNSLILAIGYLLLSNAFAVSIPEIETKNTPMNRVENFEEEIMYLFGRFQSFYDGMNFQMRTYRLSHVELVTSTFNTMMEVFGGELDFIRRASVELDEVIEQRENQLGGVNDCLQMVINERNQLSDSVTRDVQACAIRANTTMQRQLREVFYPSFAEIQGTAFNVNILVMDALSRGNVMQDEQEIIDYLEDQYRLFSTQWPPAVTQRLRWEQARFRVESQFYIEEMRVCLNLPTLNYITRAARLEHETEMC